MNKRQLLVPFILAWLLIACSGQEAPATAPSGAAAAPETTTAEPAVDAAASEPSADSVATDAATSSSATPAPMPPPAGALVAGRDYEEIPGGQPFAPLDGKIEVVEVINYVCPACAAFQPLVNTWLPGLPADVRFTYVPAAFGPRWDPYVRAYYAAESMGIAKSTHDAAFNAIHVERVLQGERGDDSAAQIAAFYGRHGVDPDRFASTMASFAIEGKFNRARQFIVRNQVDAVPTIIVNGKYRIKGDSFGGMLENADAMIARERAAQARVTQ